MAGTIVYLNGTSSAGKTTIGVALQDALDEPFLLLGIDTIIRMLPRRTFRESWFVPGPDGGLRPGPAIRAQTRPPMLATIVALAANHDLIVDDVIADPETLQDTIHALAPFNVLFVGVECPLEVSEQRERERGDRAVGLARGLAPLVHAHGVYDTTVDSSKHSPAECADAIKRRLAEGPPPTAFAELRARSAGTQA
jgi:chloramphenicol 3-O phosphotransferase